MFGSGALATSATLGRLSLQQSTTPKRPRFAHNERVAAALAPSLLWLAVQGGGPMASILMVGSCDGVACVIARCCSVHFHSALWEVCH